MRPAQFEDAGELSELLAKAYSQFEPTFPWPDLWCEYFADVTDVTGRWAKSRILVAERDGSVAGTVDYYCPPVGGYVGQDTLDLIEPSHRDRFTFEPGWAAVRFLAVAPERSGSGVGRTLMAACIERARADGATHVFLHSLPIMTTAIELYATLGFERLPERDFGIRDGGSEQVLAFRLALVGSP